MQSPLHTLRQRRAVRLQASRGFTLMEIMFAIAIISALTLITLIGGKTADNASRRARTVAEIAAIGTALESYKSDNVTFPVPASGTMPNPATDGDPAGYTASAQLLFTALSGRATFDTSPLPGVKSYYPYKRSQVSTLVPSAAVDGWGNSLGYNSVNPVYNVGFFDIWSTANANDISKKSQWIGNFKTD